MANRKHRDGGGHWCRCTRTNPSGHHCTHKRRNPVPLIIAAKGLSAATVKRAALGKAATVGRWAR
jgi:hypothetical protein